MITNVNKNVLKDAEKVPNEIKMLLLKKIEELEKADTIFELANIEHMEGTDEPYYRIKMGKYRILIHYEKEKKKITIHALKHRKDAYKRENLPWKR